jgi:hypothetical protein
MENERPSTGGSMIFYLKLMILCLLVKHFLVDFCLQTEYQWKNKGNLLHPGGYLHAGLNAAGTAVVFTGFASNGVYFDFIVVFALLAFEFVTHYAMDWAKTNINKAMNWTATTSPMFFVMLGFDQLFHLSVLMFIAFYLF